MKLYEFEIINKMLLLLIKDKESCVGGDFK